MWSNLHQRPTEPKPDISYKEINNPLTMNDMVKVKLTKYGSDYINTKNKDICDRTGYYLKHDYKPNETLTDTLGRILVTFSPLLNGDDFPFTDITKL